MVVTVAFLATPARNRLAGSAITVFSSNTFALALFHCKKVVSTELFLKGASQHSYQAVKTLPFPMAVCKCSPSGMHGSNNAKIRSFLSSTCQKAYSSVSEGPSSSWLSKAYSSVELGTSQCQLITASRRRSEAGPFSCSSVRTLSPFFPSSVHTPSMPSLPSECA